MSSPHGRQHCCATYVKHARKGKGEGTLSWPSWELMEQVIAAARRSLPSIRHNANCIDAPPLQGGGGSDTVIGTARKRSQAEMRELAAVL